MSTIYIQEAANLFVNDHDPASSNHLTISDLKLPNLEENTQDYHPGGSRVGIEVEVGMAKLEASFTLAGHSPQVLRQFGLGSKAPQTFSAYGVIRDKRTGEAIESKAVLRGLLAKADPQAFTRGNLQSHEFAIKSIMHYELFFNGEELFYWDFHTAEWRVNGQSQVTDERRILRIPTAS